MQHMEPFLRTIVRLSSLSKYLNRPANSHDFAISLTKFIFSRGITTTLLMSRFQGENHSEIKCYLIEYNGNLMGNPSDLLSLVGTLSNMFGHDQLAYPEEMSPASFLSSFFLMTSGNYKGKQHLVTAGTTNKTG